MKLHNRQPDIENLYKVLRCETPDRPTLFEYFMNDPLFERLTGRKAARREDELGYLRFIVDGFHAAGYDYATTAACSMVFAPQHAPKLKKTFSLNDSFGITDEASFEAFQWPTVEEQDFSVLEKIRDYLPDGMKLLVRGPSGIFTNTLYLVGYENLCLMIYENPELVHAIVDNIGARMIKYYETAVQYESVGLIISNDDWGFKTQTLISPDQMREFMFPWHRKIVETGHRAGLPVLLHCCGFFDDVIDDVIGMGFDAKHSYEDAIQPVEDFYEKWTGKMAVLGGIDMDFIMRSTDEELIARCQAMLERSASRGGYALGTGNSIPEFIPQEKFLTMIRVALAY